VQNKELTAALAMIERLMRVYEISLSKAIECAHSCTMISKEALKKAWHEKHEEER
jgi:hypothetical protein